MMHRDDYSTMHISCIEKNPEHTLENSHVVHNQSQFFSHGILVGQSEC